MNRLNPNFNGMTNTKKIISATAVGATYTLTKDDSGALFLFDRAAGCAVTLPANVPGLSFEFACPVSASGGAYKVITAVGTELMVGTLWGVDTDTSDTAVAYPALASDSYISINMNGTTTGIIGSRFIITNLTATQWQVDGTILGNSTVATSWATS
jgi:hypothetical protein